MRNQNNELTAVVQFFAVFYLFVYLFLEFNFDVVTNKKEERDDMETVFLVVYLVFSGIIDGLKRFLRMRN